MEPIKKLANWMNIENDWRAAKDSVGLSPLMSSQARMKKATGMHAITSNMRPHALFIRISKLEC
jgi:hypothetical protein